MPIIQIKVSVGTSTILDRLESQLKLINTLAVRDKVNIGNKKEAVVS